MKRSTTPDGGCTGGLTMYQDVWQCLRSQVPGNSSTLGQVAKEACSNLTACVAVFTPSPRPGTNAYVMVFGSKQDLDNVQSCSDRDRGVVTPTWGQDPNGEDATCFTKVKPAPTPAPAVSYVETPMKRSTTPDGGCTGGLTMYQDVWQCLRSQVPGNSSTLGQVAKEACSNLTACVAVFTPSPRPGTNAYVMVFGSKQDL